jgi:CubicO group peptidase (beta-lactamase class C family)
MSWDDPVVRHLPWFQLPDPWVTREVTLRDLLAHHLAGELGNSSWIFDYTGLATEEKLRRLRFLEPVPPRFRSSTSYSNINYAIAGAVIEAVSGMSWSDFFRSRLLEPVGMTSATPDVCEAYANPDIDSDWAENLVTPHAPSESGPRPISAAPLDCTTAASIGANVHDVTAWLRLQLGEGSIDGVRVLSAEAVEEMHSVQAARPGWDLESVAFGLGWFVQTYRGHKIVVGGGGTAGQKHRIGLIPEQELGVVVLTNQRGHPYQSRLPDALIRFVFDAYLGEPRVDWSEQYLESASAQNDQLQTQFDVFQAQRVAGTAPSLPLSRYTGTYSHSAFGDVVISDEGGGSLNLTFQDGQSWTLEHWHYDVYRILLGLDPPPPFFLTFVIGPFGQVSELSLGGVEGVWQR